MNLKKLVLLGLIFQLLCINVFAAKSSEELIHDNISNENEIENSENFYVIQKKKDVIPIILAATMLSSLSAFSLHVLYDQAVVKKRINKKSISEIDKILEGIRVGNPELLENFIKVAMDTVNKVESKTSNT